MPRAPLDGRDRRYHAAYGLALVERLTIRTVLLAGFGLMLGLWLFAGYQVTQRVCRRAQRNSAAVSARYQQAQELLASVRTQVLEASVLLRDALLDPDATAQAEHRQRSSRPTARSTRCWRSTCRFSIRRRNASASTVCARRSANSDRASDEVLATDSSRWPAEARTLLRRFMPKRESAIRVSDEVQALNRAAFIDQQRALTEMQVEMQRQVWTVFGVALGISLVIGWLASRHAASLERRLTEQHVARSALPAICSGCRRGSSRRAKKSSGASRASCTMTWARR